MKAFPDLSLKSILNEIIEAFNRFNARPVRVESVSYLSPVEIRRYVRRLRENRQSGIGY
jgi:hypothetical protein